MSSSRSSSFDIAILLFLVLACVVGLMAVWKIRFEKDAPQKPPTPVVQKQAPPAPVPTATSTPSLPSRLVPVGLLCNEGATICVNTVYKDALIANPFSVTGTVMDVPKRGLYWALEDPTGRILESGNISAADIKDGAFNLRSFFLTTPSSSAAILVFAHVGVEQAPRLRLPVRVSTKTSTVTIHHLGLKDEPKEDGYTCPDAPLKTLAVETKKIMETRLPIEATLRTALSAPSGALKDFNVRNGTAAIIFERGVWGAFDACTRRIEQASIEKTLQQFSTIERVTFAFTHE